jgi:2-keto-4-pentenoate hydratase
LTNQAIIEECSSLLWEAEKSCSPINTLTSIYSQLTHEDAYAIQAATLRRRSSQGVGFKLGYTSAAMRAQMNIAEPNYGVLTKDHLLDHQEGALDGYIPFGELIHPLVEPEIAILINQEISGAGHTRHTIESHVEAVMPALEIVDTRYKEYKFSLVDNISDNSSGARVVLGAPKKLSQIDDLRLSGVLLWSEGHTLDTGVGANSMGDPLVSIAWLANFLAQQELSIPAGSIIMTGGLTKAHPAKSQQTFLAEFGGLGNVKAYFS